MGRLYLTVLLMSLIVTLWFPGVMARSGGPGLDFYEKTSIRPDTPRRGRPPKDLPLVPAKKYDGAEKISLPEADKRGLLFEEALVKRRSSRGFRPNPITLGELSQLLFAAQGITGKIGDLPLRTAPSAGGLYPMEIYLVVVRVDSLKPGIYHYQVHERQLEFIRPGDFGKEVARISVGQDVPENAAVTFVLTSVWERVTLKYRERGHRYSYIEAGCISQNIALQAASIGLDSNCVGAFYDEQIHDLLGIDGRRESALFLHCIGKTG